MRRSRSRVNGVRLEVRNSESVSSRIKMKRTGSKQE